MKLTRWPSPSLTNWPTFGRLADLREELDRFFEAPLAEFTRSSQFLGGWTPPLDVYESKDQFVVKAELPGLRKEDIDVSLHEGVLSISGEHKGEKESKDAEVIRSERFFGRFQRAITLPASVTADKIKAEYRDGVLTVTLPKAEEAKPKQIAVSVD